MQPAVRRALLLGIAAAVAIPAIAQNAAAPPAPQPGSAPPAVAQPARTQTEALSETDTNPAVEVQVSTQLPVVAAPAIEYPRYARRDPFTAGALDPVEIGLGTAPWGSASGVFLSSVMRRMDTPIASRWAHIALRNALLASAHSPNGVNPVDWAAERAWLLLRMGEADASRLLISSVDTDRFTPKMTQVAVQSALANSDPLGLCNVGKGLGKAEPRISPLVQAMCSALNGESESASAQIDTARRRGSVGGVDLALAQKVAGAASDTGTASTIEWEPVDALTSWRFGLSTGTAMSPPKRLLDSASPQIRAWYARSPLIPFQDRLQSARIAAGLGVFSSQSLTDFYSMVYDSTDPNDLGGTDAWQLRLAFAGADEDARIAAMRRLWTQGSDRLEKEGARAMLGRASSRITPDSDRQADAPDLIASMLAAGMDREAGRWANAVRQMDDSYADQAWAMIALGAPDGTSVDLSVGRISAFIDRDESKDHKRSALLVAGLAALGRLDIGTASRLNRRFGLHIERGSPWTQLIDAAARRRQPGSVLILAGTGLQARDFDAVPSAHLFHIVMDLRNTGQEFSARMIAAEALART